MLSTSNAYAPPDAGPPEGWIDHEALGDWYDDEPIPDYDTEEPIGVGHWVHTPYDDLNEGN